MKFQNFRISVYDDEALIEMNRFLSTHRIVAVAREHVTLGDQSFWDLLVEYLEDPNQSQKQKHKSSDVDYSKILSSEDFQLFEKLRKLRKSLGKDRGVPLYVIAKNEDLALIAQKRPKTEEELNAIEEIAATKREKFGKDFIKVVLEYEESQTPLLQNL